MGGGDPSVIGLLITPDAVPTVVVVVTAAGLVFSVPVDPRRDFDADADTDLCAP